MFESSSRKSVNISGGLLILLALSLSGCGYAPEYGYYGHLYAFPFRKFIITGFPIKNTSIWMEHMGDYITGSLRVLFSIVVYAILLSLLATIPLYIKKLFENKVLFQYYVLYWLVASLIFASLFLLLQDILPNADGYRFIYSYIMLLLSLCGNILLPALLPAFYQHYKKRLIN